MKRRDRIERNLAELSMLLGEAGEDRLLERLGEVRSSIASLGPDFANDEVFDCDECKGTGWVPVDFSVDTETTQPRAVRCSKGCPAEDGT